MTMQFKVLIATDSFKGSLSATDVCVHIQQQLASLEPSLQTDILPLADGGEGSLEALEAFLPTQRIFLTVSDPIGRQVNAFYLYDSSTQTAYIEMAQASGLGRLQPNEYNPLQSSTAGTGQLIAHALANHAERIYLFIGGSATTDAGTGMLNALGMRFFDKNQHEIMPCGASLPFVESIDTSGFLLDKHKVEFVLACDVDNPLYGLQGAAHVYAPQKGASAENVDFLDNGLRNIARIFERYSGVAVHEISGSGAAGGTAAACLAFCNANLRTGADVVFEISGLTRQINTYSLIITGEGKIDSQTAHSKLINRLCSLAKPLNIPVWAIAGQCTVDGRMLKEIGIDYAIQLLDYCTNLHDCIQNPLSALEKATGDLSRRIVECIQSTKHG